MVSLRGKYWGTVRAKLKSYRIHHAIRSVYNNAVRNKNESIRNLSAEISQLQQINAELEQRLMEINRVEIKNSHLQESIRRLDESKKDMDEKIDVLSKENAKLRSDVWERESQIFSLQPYRQELTTSEAKKEYMDLVFGIKAFIDNWTYSLLQDQELETKSVIWAQRHAEVVNMFKKDLFRYEDLYNTILFPDIDIDTEILVAYILRFLGECVFRSRTCFDTTADQLMDLVNESMRNSENPKPDEFTIRSWRAQTSLALVMDSSIRKKWQEQAVILSHHLAYVLGFIAHDNDHEEFKQSISDNIIGPALKLQEKFITSTNDFFMEIHTRVWPGKYFEGEIHQLRDLECKNISANMGKFNVDKLVSTPNVEQIRRELYIICSLCPALLVSSVGRGESLQEPYIACKEETLVAWKPGERGEELMANFKRGSGSWLYKVLNTREPTRFRELRDMED